MQGSVGHALRAAEALQAPSDDVVQDLGISGDIRSTGLLVTQPVKVGFQLPRDGHDRSIQLGLLPDHAVRDMTEVSRYAQNCPQMPDQGTVEGSKALIMATDTRE